MYKGAIFGSSALYCSRKLDIYQDVIFAKLRNKGVQTFLKTADVGGSNKFKFGFHENILKSILNGFLPLGIFLYLDVMEEYSI